MVETIGKRRKRIKTAFGGKNGGIKRRRPSRKKGRRMVANWFFQLKLARLPYEPLGDENAVGAGKR